MYEINYLPTLRRDIKGVMWYLIHRLGSPQAAGALMKEFVDTVERLSHFPYAHELYTAQNTLFKNKEVRKVPIKGYVLYYSITDNKVSLWRLLHGKRDRSTL